MGVISQEDRGIWPCDLEAPSGLCGLDFGNWRANIRKAHIRSLPLTITIAAQRLQEELGLRSRAVRIPYHHLSDRQMVHKGQQSFVSSPVGARRSGSAPATHLPQNDESPVALPTPSPLGLVSITVTVQSGVHAAPVQTAGTALDPRL